ncbi:RDD family protein [Chitinilyticum litopenaei]|uniref:RDD family protein n=1 Tax=Chitinilyticum litopenaei TaxID=1121276 RepID=UPI000407F673|nr:RDD family protein [Chitinilyticum litopenaei]
MYCPHCGQPHGNGRFCQHCGGKLPAELQSGLSLTPSDSQPAPAADPYAASAASLQTVSLAAEDPRDHFGYAGFWERFAAHFIDNLLIGIVAYGLVIVIFMLVGLGAVTQGGEAMSALGVLAMLLTWVILIVVPWLYFAKMESGERRATLGKRALGLAVQRDDGEAIGFGRASGRYFAKMISAMVLMIGYLIQPFTARKQALHDMMSDVVVVRTRERSGGALWVVVGVVVLFVLVAVIGILAAIAIPAYSEYQKKALLRGAEVQLRAASTMVGEYYLSNDGKLPASLAAAGYTASGTEGVALEFDADNGVIAATFSKARLQDAKLEFVPSLDDEGNVQWQCEYSGLSETEAPKDCLDAVTAQQQRDARAAADAEAEAAAAAAEPETDYAEEAPVNEGERPAVSE